MFKSKTEMLEFVVKTNFDMLWEVVVEKRIDPLEALFPDIDVTPEEYMNNVETITFKRVGYGASL